MRVVCAWCGTVMAESDDERTTHTICLPCTVKVFREEGKTDDYIRQFFERGELSSEEITLLLEQEDEPSPES